MYFTDQRQLYMATAETLLEIAKENYGGFQTARLLGEALSRHLLYMGLNKQTQPIVTAAKQLILWSILHSQSGKLPNTGETCLSPFQLKVLADEIDTLLET